MELSNGLMPKDDVRAMIDQLVRPGRSPGSESPSRRQCEPTTQKEPVAHSCADEIEYVRQICLLHDTISKQKAQLASAESELQGAKQQLQQAGRHIDMLDAELADIGALTSELQMSLTQSENDKAILMAELEKQLRERQAWADKCRNLESAQGAHDLQIVDMQTRIAELSVSQIQAQQNGGDAASNQQVTRLRSDLHCLLHKLSLLESSGTGEGGGLNQSRALGQDAAPVTSTPSLPLRKEVVGVRSCCEIGENSNKDVAAVVETLPARIALAASPCRKRTLVGPAKTVSTPGSVVTQGASSVSVPAATVKSVSVAPIAPIIQSPSRTVVPIPAGIATMGGSVSVSAGMHSTVVTNQSAMSASCRSVDSPVHRRTSLQPRVRSSSPTRQCSRTTVVGRTLYTPRVSVGQRIFGGSVQAPPPQSRATVPAHPAGWSSYAPAVPTVCREFAADASFGPVRAN